MHKTLAALARCLPLSKHQACQSERYMPVAVTVQLTTKVKVSPGAKAGPIVRPPTCSDPMGGLALGHILITLEAQVTAVQLRPCTAASVTTVPGAAVGPRLLMVMV